MKLIETKVNNNTDQKHNSKWFDKMEQFVFKI